jgi:hypothetical protein
MHTFSKVLSSLAWNNKIISWNDFIHTIYTILKQKGMKTENNYRDWAGS